jgi:FixJ family two-component response regulator/signal transduction histidine kinase
LRSSLSDRDSSGVLSPSHELLRFEQLLAELSAGFINLPAARVDAAITDALRRIAESLGVDRSQLIRFSEAGDEAAVTHSGALEGVPAASRRPLSQVFPWAIQRLRAGYPVVIPRVDELPFEAAVDKASFQTIGVKSNLTTPLIVAGKMEGAIALGCLRRERGWPADLVARTGVLATIFGNALAHKRAQSDLDAAIGFEHLVSEILAAMLTARRAELDGVIEAGLADMARVFGAERATLWQRVAERSEFTKTHRWLAEGVPTPPGSTAAVPIPWISARLVAGAVVRFARHADLPRAAATDLAALAALDIRSAVIVPLAVSGEVVGALSFATAREDREWPDALVPRVRLVGEVFASVLARREAERREQEAQAQAAHATRVGTMGVFAASIVHELTQPLAAILANAETAAELLAAPSPDVDELRPMVADIVADDRRAGELIQQLRKFLRRGELERTELDLRELVDEVVRLVGNEASAKGIAVVLDLPEALPKVVANRVQIEQVLVNLLVNGFDAVAANEPGSRRVAVRAHPSGTGATITVTDSGRGMDEPTLARVFEPFFTTKPGGMGLGLSISRTIVAAHGGTLSARSTPGEGTAFRIELPAGAQDAPRPAQPALVAARAGGTVFVIDDDPSMRRALERQLQGAGYSVETFASAQAYLDRMPPAGAACIVSDVRMPGLSGLDLQTALAQAGRELPMVFISGHGDVATTVHAMRAGAVSFLGKPFGKDALLAAVAEALARSRERESAREKHAEIRARYDSLTPREREVLALVTAGLVNKIIADRLGAAEKTIKIHRGRVMEKMSAGSVADLVRMSERLGLQPAPESARS